MDTTLVRAAWEWVVWVYEFILFLVRGTAVSIGDFYVMYTRVGRVWRRRQHPPASMERRDLVVQLAPLSPSGSTLDATTVVLHFNESFIDRRFWKSLNMNTAMPVALVTGVSCGGIGFYTALNLILCGVNVCGVVRSAAQAQKAERVMHAAVERQCQLHKELAGKVGRLALHLCDLRDQDEVLHLADVVSQDPNLRFIVCNAGPMATPLALSPQGLEEEFAVHCAGHSLLVLRMLQARMVAQRDRRYGSNRACPFWRIVFLCSGAAATAHPTASTSYRTWDSTEELKTHMNRFDSYGNAKMCELLFAFALARFIRHERLLAPYVSVLALHPGPIRSRVLPNSGLPMCWLLDGELAALFRMTPIIAALYVTDLILCRRHEHSSGHFFRMGEDQTIQYNKESCDPAARKGFWKNSAIFPGIPGPAVSLSRRCREQMWNLTINYFTDRGYISAEDFAVQS